VCKKESAIAVKNCLELVSEEGLKHVENLLNCFVVFFFCSPGLVRCQICIQVMRRRR
jgi:hypothetical protein